MNEMNRERPVAACNTRMAQSFASDPEWPNHTRRSAAARRDPEQFFGERDRVLVRIGQQTRARHASTGLRDRGGESRMAVAQNGRAA